MTFTCNNANLLNTNSLYENLFNEELYKFTIIWNEGNISRRMAWGSWKSASTLMMISLVGLIVVLYKDEWKEKHTARNYGVRI